ncbi:hypothetical protein QFC24_005226 [Naganishia onofrii]|uniref:Uncharacterized protein n=1 Tax=Naganishia onofrii TaxID=1851511 RepID=A0ACC2X943_9TREE|nr:hypothetical protein QFC24_005226 [Naganishia onofrii]
MFVQFFRDGEVRGSSYRLTLSGSLGPGDGRRLIEIRAYIALTKSFKEEIQKVDKALQQSQASRSASQSKMINPAPAFSEFFKLSLEEQLREKKILWENNPKGKVKTWTPESSDKGPLIAAQKELFQARYDEWLDLVKDHV